MASLIYSKDGKRRCGGIHPSSAKHSDGRAGGGGGCSGNAIIGWTGVCILVSSVTVVSLVGIGTNTLLLCCSGAWASARDRGAKRIGGGGDTQRAEDSSGIVGWGLQCMVNWMYTGECESEKVQGGGVERAV